MRSHLFNLISASGFMLLVFWGSCDDNQSNSTSPGKSDEGYTTPPQTDAQMGHDQMTTGSNDIDTNKINTVTGEEPK
ncbi:MAG: hypothetical protein M3R27_10695 [Bacteroidota bacterium]|nr:hypothetical protein [Bacteroidota bacterium]